MTVSDNKGDVNKKDNTRGVQKFINRKTEVYIPGSVVWIKKSYELTRLSIAIIATVILSTIALTIILSTPWIVLTLMALSITVASYNIYNNKHGYYGPIVQYSLNNTHVITEEEYQNVKAQDVLGETYEFSLRKDDIENMGEAVTVFSQQNLRYVIQEYRGRYKTKVNVEFKQKVREGTLKVKEDSVRLRFWLNKKSLNTAIGLFVFFLVAWVGTSVFINYRFGDAIDNIPIMVSAVGIVYAAIYIVFLGALYTSGARPIFIGRLYVAKVLDINYIHNTVSMAMENKHGEYVTVFIDDLDAPDILTIAPEDMAEL